MTEIMTLSEFEQAIEEWGKNWGIETEVVVEDDWTFVFANRIGRSSGVVATISNKDVCILSFSRLETMALADTERQTLFKIVMKFANTWPSDRKDKEKKYLLRFKSIKSEAYCYLNYNKGTDRFGLDDSFNTVIRFQTHFSLDDIEWLKEKLDTDLSDFEIIEVEEDEK